MNAISGNFKSDIRPASVSDEARLAALSTWSNPPPAPPLYVPPTGPVKLEDKDYIAAAVMAIIMIGPLAAAAIGRLMMS